MALSRALKALKVERLAGELEHSTSAIIGTFSGLTASKDFELRKAVRGAGGSYHVVKNKLAGRAAQGSKIEAVLQDLKGVSSVAYTSGDPVALAKALSTWVKDNAEFTFKLGIVDGTVITVEEIKALATLPGKEELFSKLLFLINSPAQRLATVLNATGRDLAVVINQAVEKDKFAIPVAVSDAEPTKAATPETPAATVPETPAEVMPEVSMVTVSEQAVAEAQSSDAAATTETSPSEPTESSVSDGHLVAEAHAVEAPAVNADTIQPENGTASQAGEAATTDPAEG